MKPFGPLDTVAPGNATKISSRTRICASLAARPGGFGMKFHNSLYQELGLDCIYKSFALPAPPDSNEPGWRERFADALRGMRALDFLGCGLSMPFKELALEIPGLVDELDPAARAIGAINTIVNLGGGRWRGYNTDTLAVSSLLRARGVPASAPAILLGSGGMARAIAYALGEAGFADVTVVARNEERGESLARDFGFRRRRELGTAPAADAPVSLLINATPIGMSAPGTDRADALPFPDDWTRSAGWLLESVAVPPETAWIRRGRALRKTVINGFDLVGVQGEEQFRLYTGVRPTAEQITRALDIART